MKQKLITILLAIVALLGGGYVATNAPLGSVESESGGYYATTTASFPATAVGGNKLLKNGPGILGSVVIVNETAGVLNFYDATTTGSHTNHPTTTITTIPASLAEGTYTFDVTFSRGLIVEFPSTNMASSTITWK